MGCHSSKIGDFAYSVTEGDTPHANYAPSAFSGESRASQAIATAPELTNYTPGSRNTLSLDDFTILRKLGQGGSASIYLARCRFVMVRETEQSNSLSCMAISPPSLPLQTEEQGDQGIEGDLVALKLIPFNTGYHQNILRERSLLARLSYPYTSRLRHAFFQSPYAVLVFDYAPGGDLHQVKQLKGRVEEGLCRYYAACIALSLGYIHRKGIVHRGLKPPNILLHADGRPCLTDFGIALRLKPGCVATSKSGSRPYMAPEAMVGTHEHDYRVDWYGLGITLYELLMGQRPYSASRMNLAWLAQHINYRPSMAQARDRSALTSSEALHELRLAYISDMAALAPHGIESYRKPDDISEEASSFIAMLLIPNPKYRLGSKGPMEVLNHPWFKDVNWKDLRESKEGPWKPPLGPTTADPELQLPAEVSTSMESPSRVPRRLTSTPSSFIGRGTSLVGSQVLMSVASSPHPPISESLKASFAYQAALIDHNSSLASVTFLANNFRPTVSTVETHSQISGNSRRLGQNIPLVMHSEYDFPGAVPESRAPDDC